METKDSQPSYPKPHPLTITATVSAYLPEEQDETGVAIASLAPISQPYWHIERARIGKSRKVAVELLMNGFPVDTTEIMADGKLNDVKFTYPINGSGWVALRVYPGTHTNPIFVEIGGKPIREANSIDWCRKAVDQCWTMKEKNTRPAERPEAKAAYDAAKAVYGRLPGDAMRE